MVPSRDGCPDTDSSAGFAISLGGQARVGEPDILVVPRESFALPGRTALQPRLGGRLTSIVARARARVAGVVVVLTAAELTLVTYPSLVLVLVKRFLVSG